MRVTQAFIATYDHEKSKVAPMDDRPLTNFQDGTTSPFASSQPVVDQLNESGYAVINRNTVANTLVSPELFSMAAFEATSSDDLGPCHARRSWNDVQQIATSVTRNIHVSLRQKEGAIFAKDDSSYGTFVYFTPNLTEDYVKGKLCYAITGDPNDTPDQHRLEKGREMSVSGHSEIYLHLGTSPYFVALMINDSMAAGGD